MKLFADLGNFLSFRIYVAAATTDVKLQVVPQSDGHRVGLTLPVQPWRSLPVLLLDSGQCLFSPNEAARYLLLQKAGYNAQLSCTAQDDMWLEWEATRLRPAVQAFLHTYLTSKKPDSAPDVLRYAELLRHLLSRAEAEYFGSGKSKCGSTRGSDYVLSVSDICLLSCLYPLATATDCSTVAGVLAQFPKVLAALQAYQQHPSVLSAVSNLNGGKQTSAIQFKESFANLPSTVFALTDTAGKDAGSAAVATGMAKSERVAPRGQLQQCGTEVDGAPCGNGDSTGASALTSEEILAAMHNWAFGVRQDLPLRVHPILPKQASRNILITSALPYVNNVPHLGNIVGCVLSADVFSRFCRLRGYNSLFICGTDEYGTATETKALEEGLTPQQICDKYHALHRSIYEWFNIGFDYFGRTTTQQQTEIAQDIFWRLHQNGHLVKDSVEQLKCEACNRFLADRFVEGTCPLCGYLDARGDQCDKCGRLINAIELRSPRCKLCSATPVVCSSQHLFLDLPKLEPQLAAYLDKTMAASNAWTNNAKDITKAWLRDGLKPRCITRDLKWGTPVPLDGYKDKVFYVWFDAPIGYISITANYTEKWPLWWKNPQQVDQYNFMAKDNVPFHSVIFPASLLGADDNYSIVNHLCATEYLNYEDGKFSKSRGVGVFGNDAQSTGIPADVWRFYLLYVRPETQDSAFSWDDLLTKSNSELLNNLGNFVNRVLKFVAESFSGHIPDMLPLTADDEQLIAGVARELRQYVEQLEKAQLREGIWRMLNVSRLGNQYMQSMAPWKLIKSGGGSADEAELQRRRAGVVIGVAANVAALLAVMLQPYMPETSDQLQRQLGMKEPWRLDANFVCHLPAGHAIGEPKPLFTKIEASLVASFKLKFAGQQTKPTSATPAAAAAATAAVKVVLPDHADNTPLPAQVEKQGNYVRQLKQQNADKALIKVEVEKLLKLKAMATAADSSAHASPAHSK